jgi:outer membrane biosynthesis protein TonB
MMRYENSLRTISVFVITFHLLFVGVCFWTGKIPPLKKTAEKLVVKTISLKTEPLPPKAVKEPEPIAMAEEAPAPPCPEPEPEPEPKPVFKPKPEPKKEVKPKKEDKPVSKPKPKTPPKEDKKPAAKKAPEPEAKPKVSKEDLRKQELIAKAQAILKTGTSSSKKSSNDSSLVSLSTISKLQIDAPAMMTDKEKRYQDILASHLKDRLRFPEYGEVKIKLTLANSGKVLKVDIVSSKSEENRNYALKTLPNILFPSFDGFIKESQHTFSITLKND